MSKRSVSWQWNIEENANVATKYEMEIESSNGGTPSSNECPEKRNHEI